MDAVILVAEGRGRGELAGGLDKLQPEKEFLHSDLLLMGSKAPIREVLEENKSSAAFRSRFKEDADGTLNLGQECTDLSCCLEKSIAPEGLEGFGYEFGAKQTGGGRRREMRSGLWTAGG
ncbi:hypothetical protein B0H13DRAFT_1893454 [Mycena leptocephala]|nr:hypothetical protein B0H13DRAFT_1893454 [Mycena leptocephala]